MRLRGRAYVTQVPAAHFGCCVLMALLVVFAVWPPPTEEDMLPPGDGLLIYSYASILFAIAFLLLFSRHILNLWNGFLAAPLLLALIGCVTLAHARSLSPPVTTYSSALIPLMICALPMMMSSTDLWLDCRSVLRYLLFVFCLASFCHLAWQLGHLAGIEAYPSLEQTFTFCFAMLLSGVTGRKLILAVVTLGTIASLALRPTSTLFVGAALSWGVIIAYRFGMRQ